MSENTKQSGSHEHDARELAHALYTVWKHAGAPTRGSLIADRIRGAKERVPWLAEQYPELERI